MLAVIVPANNEEAAIGMCLRAVAAAACWPGLQGEPVLVIVVLDACTDGTAGVAVKAGALIISVEARNVGIARSEGARLALALGARWLAFTDADTVVAPDWLHEQMSLCSDAVCGTVGVSDWGAYGEPMRRHFAATYTDADGHQHIHGANLGVSAQAYQRVGGFAPLASSEDVALVRALEAIGARIAWSAAPRVVTSARHVFRAPGGFGATLVRVSEAHAVNAGATA
ncbi:glycosyltransferase family 2 protein [Hydrogenophaga sp.]|uniref:glycosyltransferase n=1 Tax=Hydrogenophaga sp. TaxID=1904254 RepID=UPI00273175C9|nr:glycosyltransferase [Hydrogenophaga sp.]MDP2019092.1 glycosyltransferase [Hydrogenophaga sp.]MDP3167861.1 glycosyltransferase [Hydrogenophaga sp.]MDP3811556.1 glycosyltransferase [Hydrogenophaga sp.]